MHRGGEAELYRVESGSGKKLTLKLYKDGLEYDARVIESLQKLSLPGIYHIVESGHVDGRAYVLYDFIDGVCSRDLSPLPLDLALFYLRKLVVSLKELLQRGVSHGDICPDNVFFEVTGITISDFCFLRDGGDYTQEDSEEVLHFEGNLFDPVVFNDSVKEFMRLRTKLADYFDEKSKETARLNSRGEGRDIRLHTAPEDQSDIHAKKDSPTDG